MPHSPNEITSAYLSPAAQPVERFPPGVLLAGRYRIVSLLGKGGMGEVYRADDLTLGQPVALKFLPAHIADNQDRLTRFRREVAAARRVSHPHVCRVYDIASVESQTFLSMEFVDGEDLCSVLKRLGRVPEEKGIEIARQICSALAAVHDQGLLHRDLKPANVLLDGRGSVRLTDFGLAAAAEDLSVSDVRSGTPLYQSPEQLSGKEVTVRSDIFALGLVLYELFTGKRAYETARRDSAPSRPSSLISGLSPTVEAAILRCLEPAPADRPRSVVEVMAALPGGDPLAAALAAGLTPSPQLVADAGASGLISTRTGLIAFASMLAFLAAFAAMHSHVMLFAKTGGFEHSTEWLTGKARAIRELSGHPEGRHFAVGYDHDNDLLDWILARDRSPDRWERLNEPPAAPICFWHRESPRPLIPSIFYPYPGSPETTRQTWEDPAPILPGMTGVRLGRDGRLLDFYAIPEDGVSCATRPVNWREWFERSRLDYEAFHATETHDWVPRVYADEVQTWVPFDSAGKPARIEAGTLRGRVVWFRATAAWHAEPARSSDAEHGDQAIGDSGSANSTVLILIPLAIAVVVLAPITLRSGRADYRGTFRLATAVFVLLMLVWGLETRHIVGKDEVQLFVMGSASALYWAAFVGFSYLVLEPYVRRWWPETIISWTRLLTGRWRDPLVGRDILAGTVVGAVWMVLYQLINLLPPLAGEPGPAPWWDWWVPNTRVPGLWLGNALINMGYSIRFGFFYCLLLLILLRVVLRKPWLTGLAFIALTSFTQIRDYRFHEPSVAWPIFVAAQAWILLALVRFGALTMIVTSFVMNTVWMPITTDVSRDYFVSGWAGYGLLVALAGFGLYTSTGRFADSTK